jgi:hypothetical protein
MRAGLLVNHVRLALHHEDKGPCAPLPALFRTPLPIGVAPFLSHSKFLHLRSSPSELPNNILQTMLFLSFGALTSLVSSAAAFNATGGSLRARHAMHDHHGKRYSSVDYYKGEDFFNDMCACSLLVWSIRT